MPLYVHGVDYTPLYVHGVDYMPLYVHGMNSTPTKSGCYKQHGVVPVVFFSVNLPDYTLAWYTPVQTPEHPDQMPLQRPKATSVHRSVMGIPS